MYTILYFTHSGLTAVPENNENHARATCVQIFDIFTAFGKYTLALRQSPEPSPPRTPV